MKELELEDDLLSKVPVRYVIHFHIKYFFAHRLKEIFAPNFTRSLSNS